VNFQVFHFEDFFHNFWGLMCCNHNFFQKISIHELFVAWLLKIQPRTDPNQKYQLWGNERPLSKNSVAKWQGIELLGNFFMKMKCPLVLIMKQA